MRRTKEDTEETKRLILEAARELFLSKGFKKTTLDDIANRAGFTRGAIHWHFENKIGVLVALRTLKSRVIQILTEKLDFDLNAGHNINSIDTLNNILTTNVRILLEDKERQKIGQIFTREVFLSNYDNEIDENYKFLIKIEQIIKNILIYARKKGHLSPIWTPETASVFIVMLIRGIIMMSSLKGMDQNKIENCIISINTFIKSLQKVPVNADAALFTNDIAPSRSVVS